ncbi:hypothetical protein FE697_020080 [Mumia zhuanghuii]|uniref:Uncharacterized protein n=2 Tax=Mumia TaxID=1546255 RepID=A0ABW1QKG9_9ACTN|nr:MULTISPECIES: hypothetical protein [Mumia]KAA1418143.1 hypothetical protein FE697_020080 [Mumia zhuanghuii]
MSLVITVAASIWWASFMVTTIYPRVPVDLERQGVDCGNVYDIYFGSAHIGSEVLTNELEALADCEEQAGDKFRVALLPGSIMLLGAGATLALWLSNRKPLLGAL